MASKDVYEQTPDELICTLLRNGWTQEAIANEVGISQATVCRIYSGTHKNPRYGTVEALRGLARALEDFEVAP